MNRTGRGRLPPASRRDYVIQVPMNSYEARRLANLMSTYGESRVAAFMRRLVDDAHTQLSDDTPHSAAAARVVRGDHIAVPHGERRARDIPEVQRAILRKILEIADAQIAKARL